MIKLHHTSFIVADLNRSLKFYCGLLGLEMNAERPDLGYPGAWLNVENQQIHLMELPEPYQYQHFPHGGRDRHVAFQIDDFEYLKEKLEQYHIPYTVSRSGRPALFCRDPDQNALEFIGLKVVDQVLDNQSII